MGPSPDQKRSRRIQTPSRYLGTRSNSANSRTNNSCNRDRKARSSRCSRRSKPPNRHFGKANSQGFRQQGHSSSRVSRLVGVLIPPVRLSVASSSSRVLGSSAANSQGFRQQGHSSS